MICIVLHDKLGQGPENHVHRLIRQLFFFRRDAVKSDADIQHCVKSIVHDIMVEAFPEAATVMWR